MLNIKKFSYKQRFKEQGYDVVGLFMRNWHDTTGTLEGDCPWYDDHMFAELTAKRLDIPFHFIDLSKEYRRRVVDYMFAEYGRGRTPNPDVLCNREIKFDAFLKAALDLGADYVATGHYCRKETIETPEGPIYRLLAGSDPNKDQSYFLCQLTQEQLSRALFPIGHLLKPEVRRIAAEQHLATAQRKDSQGICFVGKVDLPVFLQQQLKARDGQIIEIPDSWSGFNASHEIAPEKENFADGPFTQQQLDALAEPYHYTPEAGRFVGTHHGAHFFTIGQRKGLGIALGRPMFVVSIDPLRNEVVLGTREELQGTTFQANHVNLMKYESIPDGLEVTAKIRYRNAGVPALLHPQDGHIRGECQTPVDSITPGQSVVFYEGSDVVGGGILA